MLQLNYCSLIQNLSMPHQKVSPKKGIWAMMSLTVPSCRVTVDSMLTKAAPFPVCEGLTCHDFLRVQKAATASDLRAETQQVEKCGAKTIRTKDIDRSGECSSKGTCIHAPANHFVYGPPLLYLYPCPCGRSFCMSSASHIGL